MDALEILYSDSGRHEQNVQRSVSATVKTGNKSSSVGEKRCTYIASWIKYNTRKYFSKNGYAVWLLKSN